MNTRIFKLSLLAIFCIGAVASNAQSNLPEETINVVKKLKVVDTKGLSADEAQTVMKVLNQIKRENSPRVEMPEIIYRGSQTQYPRVELAGMKVEAIPVAEKPLFILDGKEISIEEFNGLNPNCVEGLKLIKGEEAVNKYGEKAANGVLAITSKKDCKQQKIDNEDVEIIYHGKVISKEEAEKMGISVNVIVGEMKDKQVKIVDAKRQRIAEMRQRRANVKNVHVVTKADLKPVNREAMAKVISCVEPMFHVRGSMAKIESVNSDELPRVTKFKQNGNQVSFRIEVPKSADRAKQKVDIEYELPAEK